MCYFSGNDKKNAVLVFGAFVNLYSDQNDILGRCSMLTMVKGSKVINTDSPN